MANLALAGILLAALPAFHDIDFDRDGHPDSLELSCATEEYCGRAGYFDVARFELSASSSNFAAMTSDGWTTSFDASRFPQPNLLANPSAFAHDFGDAGVLLFLFGQPHGGSSGPGVSVYSIRAAGAEKYFEPFEFEPVEFIAPAKTGEPWRMIASLSSAEPFDDPAFPDAHLETYCPTTVFILGKSISIDEVETERRARKQYGAYAGPKPREDVVVVRRADSNKIQLLYWPSRKPVE
jgi:hypothetical protein